MRLQTCVASIALSITLTAPAFAADPNQWTNLQSLRRGDHIRIVRTDQSSLDGQFDNVNDTGITIETAGPTKLAKEDVVRVSVRKGMSRRKRTLIGAGIGLGVGGAIAAGVGTHSNDEGWFGGVAGGFVTVIAVGGGCLIGTLVGAFSGGGYKTVYRTASKH